MNFRRVCAGHYESATFTPTYQVSARVERIFWDRWEFVVTICPEESYLEAVTGRGYGFNMESAMRAARRTRTDLLKRVRPRKQAA